MLKKFKQKQLFIYLNNLDNEIIGELDKALGGLCWASGEPVDGPFIRKLNSCYLCCEDDEIFYTFMPPEDAFCLPVSTFIEEVKYGTQNNELCEMTDFEDIDVLQLLEEK